MPRSLATPAARSESVIKTMALTEETVPRRTHSNILSEVSLSRPQSSALTIRNPAPWLAPVVLGQVEVFISILCRDGNSRAFRPSHSNTRRVFFHHLFG